MPDATLNAALQLIVGLGLLNVWVLRRANRTSYRGGSAQSLHEEFAAYGLPPAMFYVVGALKVMAGLVLLGGLWWPLPVRAAAGIVAALMVGAIVMHVKIKDPVVKSVPAIMLLAMSALLVVRT